MWEWGTADRRLSTCLRASLAHDTVAVHPCNPATKVVWKLFHFVLCLHVFVFPVLFSFRFRFIFVRADFYVSVSVFVNGFIIFSLTNIFVSAFINENHTNNSKCYNAATTAAAATTTLQTYRACLPALLKVNLLSEHFPENIWRLQAIQMTVC